METFFSHVMEGMLHNLAHTAYPLVNAGVGVLWAF